MVMQLPIVEIDEKKYFDDSTLQEYRHVDDIMDTIRYHELGTRKVKLLQERVDLSVHPKKIYRTKPEAELKPSRTGRKM